MSLFRGVSSATLSGNLPYIIFDLFTLVSVTINNFLSDDVYDAVSIQTLTNICFRFYSYLEEGCPPLRHTALVRG